MEIYVNARPNAKSESVATTDGIHFTVSVKEPPRDGRANARIIELVAEYFSVPRAHVEIVRGARSRKKVVIVHSKTS